LAKFTANAPGLVPGQQLGRRAALRLIVEIEIAERLAAGVTDKLWGISDIVKVLED